MNRNLEKLEDLLTKTATTIENLKKDNRAGEDINWKKVQELDTKLYYLRVALGFVILNQPTPTT
ncbi:hypothetical protein Q5H92_14560 [Hymenobacter sp. M29]|uniref:Uncharacterized protein n=1 Tax=Hymenobacter mellowenesis TaxID=3063995 RepID=A0ABT9ACK4_9BACT|nr:hypothetical protein [Hymenobacter sp. M29]MDO7847589.1 hypothetical protein [Hymenobacter sp. M29]